nr:hypothetical protein [Nitrosomonas nitrosa]
MRLREAALGIIAAFALNWVWENAQAPLYKGYAGFSQDVWMCTVATLGDVAIVAVIWLIVAFSWRDPAWHRRCSLNQTLVAILLGVVIAIAIEYRALASARWDYDVMPLIPFTGIGLVPILQMAILPSILFRLMDRVAPDDTA